MKVLVFTCSELEARNYGRFLHGILTDATRWHNDEQAFMQDNRTKVAGKPVYLPGFQMRWTAKTTVAIEDIIKWTDFKIVVKKWHRKIFRVSLVKFCVLRRRVLIPVYQSLLHCLESKQSVHIYNALLVLKELLGVFPRADVADSFGSLLNNAVDLLLKEEKRGDIKILGKSCVSVAWLRYHITDYFLQLCS